MIKQGRVIRIFDDEKIAINLGSEDGVAKGTRIAIYAPEVEIDDPETGESLGVYRHLKAVARAATVSDRFTVAGPYPRREEVAVPNPMNFIGIGRTPTRTKTVPGDLPVNDMEAAPLPGGDEIRIGDLVEIEFEDARESSTIEAQEAASEGG
jgi:hypothetical protein